MAVEWPRSLRFQRRLIMPNRDSDDEDDEDEPAVRFRVQQKYVEAQSTNERQKNTKGKRAKGKKNGRARKGGRRLTAGATKKLGLGYEGCRKQNPHGIPKIAAKIVSALSFFKNVNTARGKSPLLVPSGGLSMAIMSRLQFSR